jgi:hypothetical protein
MGLSLDALFRGSTDIVHRTPTPTELVPMLRLSGQSGLAWGHGRSLLITVSDHVSGCSSMVNVSRRTRRPPISTWRRVTPSMCCWSVSLAQSHAISTYPVQPLGERSGPHHLMSADSFAEVGGF